MKIRKPVTSFILVAVILPEVLGRIAAETTNKIGLESLARQYLPGCQFRLDGAGKPEALIAPTSEALDLTAAARENPEPKEALGYWYSPTMEFLSRQKIRGATPQDAAGVIKLLHALWRGPDFVKQKIYNARPFDGGWVVEVDHDFTQYPGKIQVNGMIVAAIPSRDRLLVTGSADTDGLANIRRMVQGIFAQAPYRISSKLFVFRNGAFEVFVQWKASPDARPIFIIAA